MAKGKKPRICIQFCRHCRSSSCFDDGFVFHRVKGKVYRVKVDGRYELEIPNKFAKELRGIILALGRQVSITLKEVGQCEACQNEIQQAGGFDTHVDLIPRQRPPMEDPDANGSMSNAIRAMEGD